MRKQLATVFLAKPRRTFEAIWRADTCCLCTERRVTLPHTFVEMCCTSDCLSEGVNCVVCMTDSAMARDV